MAYLETTDPMKRLIRQFARPDVSHYIHYLTQQGLFFDKSGKPLASLPTTINPKTLKALLSREWIKEQPVPEELKGVAFKILSVTPQGIAAAEKHW